MNVHYESLSQELMRQLRGRRSQVGFSRRLGFASNVAYAWESGRRWPGARTFFRAAALDRDVVAAVESLLGRSPDWLTERAVGEDDWIAGLLGDLRGHTPIQTLAARTGRSRFAVARWLRGEAEPRLPDLLRLVDALSKLLPFVARFADPADLPAIARHHRRAEAIRDLAWQLPWATAVLLALELTAYRALPAHDDAWLARRLGLPLDTIVTLVERLRAAGQVRRQGGHLAPVTVQNLDLRKSGSAPSTRIKEHWADVAADRMAGTDDATCLYNVFTVSDADLERIRALQRAHHRAIRALVSQSAPPERVVLLNLQLLPLDAP